MMTLVSSLQVQAQEKNDQLETIINDGDEEYNRLGMEVDELQQALAESRAPKSTLSVHTREVQTMEPYPQKVREIC